MNLNFIVYMRLQLETVNKLTKQELARRYTTRAYVLACILQNTVCGERKETVTESSLITVHFLDIWNVCVNE